MRIATGVGKSHELREQIKHIIPQLPPGTCLVILTPTHNLNDEHLERLVVLLENMGVEVAVYRGRNARDPARPGKKMCDFAPEASKLAAAGGEPLHLCERKIKGKLVRCKFRDMCGYRKQDTLTAQVWIGPHALLTRKRPSCIPKISALMIDEDPRHTFFDGFDKNHAVRVSMDELNQIRFVPIKHGGDKIDFGRTADLESANAALRRALLNVDGVISTKILAQAGLTLEIVNDANRATLKSKKQINVSPNMPAEDLRKLIKEAAIHNGPIFRLSRFWRLIGDAIEAGLDIVPGCRIERGIDIKDGPQYDAVRLRCLKPVHEDWRQPTMILSATAEPQILRYIWPQLELVADVNPITPHTTVTQILWSASKAKLENNNSLRRLRRFAEVEAFKHRGKGVVIDGRQVDVLFVAQKAAKEDLIALTLPDNIDTAHFNAVEGIDKWGVIACEIIAGRTIPPPIEAELMAEVLTGKVVDRGGIEFPNGFYPRKIAGIRVKGAGEIGHPTLVEYHPDSLCEAIRRCVCEGGVIQANGRGRAVNRDEDSPLHIVIIGTLPLPLEVDVVLSADAIEPDPRTLMAARGLLPAPTATHGQWAIVQKVLCDRFNTDRAARDALTRANANREYILANARVSDFIPAKVKIKGTRYAVPVLIDPSQGDLREAAERLLGPLDSFEVAGEPRPDHTPSQPSLAPAPPTNAAEAPQRTYNKHDVRTGLGISRLKMDRLIKRRGVRELYGKEQERALIEAMMMAASPAKVAAFAASLSAP
jgi:putative DNA primase/helicase